MSHLEGPHPMKPETEISIDVASILMSLCTLPSRPSSPTLTPPAGLLRKRSLPTSSPGSIDSVGGDTIYLKPRRMSIQSDGPGHASRVTTPRTPSVNRVHSYSSADSTSSSSIDGSGGTTDDEELATTDEDDDSFVEHKQQQSTPPSSRRHLASTVKAETHHMQPMAAVPSQTHMPHFAANAAPLAPAVHPRPPAPAVLLTRANNLPSVVSSHHDHAALPTAATPPAAPRFSPPGLASLPLSTQARYSQSICCRHVVIAYSIFQSKSLSRERDAQHAARAQMQQQQQQHVQHSTNTAPKSIFHMHADPLAPAIRLRHRLLRKTKAASSAPMHAQTVYERGSAPATPMPTAPSNQAMYQHQHQQHAQQHAQQQSLTASDQMRLFQQLQACNSGQQSTLHFAGSYPPTTAGAPSARPVAARPLVHLAHVLHSHATHGQSANPPVSPHLPRRPAAPSATTVAASAVSNSHASGTPTMARTVQRRASLNNSSAPHASLPPPHPHAIAHSTVGPNASVHSSSLSLPSVINLSIHSSKLQLPPRGSVTIYADHASSPGTTSHKLTAASLHMNPHHVATAPLPHMAPIAH